MVSALALTSKSGRGDSVKWGLFVFVGRPNPRSFCSVGYSEVSPSLKGKGTLSLRPYFLKSMTDKVPLPFREGDNPI